jgi:hypothetical protein
VNTAAIRDAALRCRALLMDGVRAAGLDVVGRWDSRGEAVTLLLRAAGEQMLHARGIDRRGLDGLVPVDWPTAPAGRVGEIVGRLRQMLEELLPAEAWRPGNEEALGWLYQYFNEPDIEVFRGTSPPKVSAEMLAAKTQLFTPRWIVRFLVENTLGQLWLRMHPDSRLREQLDYLVPRNDSGGCPVPCAARGGGSSGPEASCTAVKDIRVLDPACGAMHFGLAVFDLLVLMYREELDRAGEPGWPRRPSVAAQADIPGAILSHNLFGFDIDPVAIDLARLVLFLKAAGLEPAKAVVPRNLHCQDVLMSHGEDLCEVLGEEGDAVFDTLFLPYDVVVTNPPYLDSRDYDDLLKEFMPAAYPAGKRNLYGAFLERSLAFLGEGGLLGIVTPQTFMFISSFAKLRAALRGTVAIETLVQTGLGTFPDAVVDAALYVLRREERAERRDESVGTYFRLTRPPDTQAKRAAFEEACAALRASGSHPRVYRCRQADFDQIPGRPWVYWITPAIRGLFGTLPRLADIAQPIVGLQTSDNFRFLRFWWELYFREGASTNQWQRQAEATASDRVPLPCRQCPAGGASKGTADTAVAHLLGTATEYGMDPFRDDAGAEWHRNRRIAFGCTDRESALATGRKWFPHLKGGDFRRWYGNQEYVVNWASDGAEIRSLGIESGKVASRPQNMDYYFRPGVTWTHTSSRGLSVRILPPGFICNVEGMAAFQKGHGGSSHETLAIMNSSFARHVIDLLNPTVHFGGREVGDLPYPQADTEAVRRLEAMVEQAIALARVDSQEDETTFDFISPAHWPGGSEDVRRRHAELAAAERRIDEEVYRLYGLEDDDRAAIEADLARNGSQDDAPSPDAGDLARAWISYAVGVVMGRFRPGSQGSLGCGRFDSATAEALRAVSTTDGIGELVAGGDDDLAVRVMKALELMLGARDAGQVIRSVAGRRSGDVAQLRRYLERGFFRQHCQQYRRRPIYWLLQSPKRIYNVYVYSERWSAVTLRTLRGETHLGRRLRDARERDDRTLVTDLEAFDGSLESILAAQDEHGRVVGWELEPDDGILVNLAPFHELVPAWFKEPADCWRRLRAGEYDWSLTARRYWPDRVLDQCRSVKSLALAHGRMDLYRGAAR